MNVMRRHLLSGAILLAAVFASPLADAATLNSDFAGQPVHHAKTKPAVSPHRMKLTLPVATTRAQLSAYNTQYFIACGNGCITGPLLNTFNAMVFQSAGMLADTNAWTGANTFSGAATFSGSLNLGSPPLINVVGISSLIPTWLGAPNSANLAAAVTDETGTGPLVFANSPVFTTPNLGVPSAVDLLHATDLAAVAPINGLLIGLSSFQSGGGTLQYADFQDAGRSGYVGGAGAFLQFSNDASSSFLTFAKSRATTKGAQGAVHTNATIGLGDGLSEISSLASDGTSWVYNSYFGAYVEGAVSTGIVPAGFLWGGMDTSGVSTTHMNLSPAAVLSIGDPTNNDYNQIILNPELIGTGPLIQVANPSSTNVGLTFETQGLGNINFDGGSFTPMMSLIAVASAVDYLTVTPSAAGSPGSATLSATGSDTNINLALTPKGSGVVAISGGLKFANLADSATAPTISSGCGGGSPSISAPNGTDAFVVTIGTASGSTCAIAMPTATNGWICSAEDTSNHTTANSRVAMSLPPAASLVTVTDYSDITGAATWVSGAKIAFLCRAY